MRGWSAGVINPREDLKQALIGRGATVSQNFHDAGDISVPADPSGVLVVGLPGDQLFEHDTVLAITEAIDEGRPRLVVWENVRGLASLANERKLQRLIDGLNIEGYVVSHGTLNGRDFTRRTYLDTAKRLWLVATDQRIDLPDPPKWPRRKVVEHTPGANPVLWAILQANGF